MATKYAKHVSTKSTPQNKPIPGKDQVANSAGGYVFSLDKWKQLERFLILGCEGGTYYAGEKELTVNNSNIVLECIKEDGIRVVNTVVEYRKENRAPKPSTLIFVLSLCSKLGNQKTRTAANSAVSDICWTATQLFEYMECIKQLGGWGRGSRRAVAEWYNKKSPEKLALQIAKYRNRNDWTHRDALRVSHAVPLTKEHDNLFGFVTEKKKLSKKPFTNIIRAWQECESAETATDVVKIITENELPWECVPNTWLKDAKVSEALLYQMPMMAMLRQLGKMSSVGLLTPMSDTAKHVIGKVANAEEIEKSKIHPISILSALNTYKGGRGIKGDLTWKVNADIIDALDEGFRASFGNVQPTNQRLYFGLDVSGSMTIGTIAGVAGLNPRVASCAMVLVSAHREPSCYVAAFGDRVMSEFAISKKSSLESIMNKADKMPVVRTDCALPMLDALKNKTKVDAFVIYTDNETWAGAVHPCQALKQYRDWSGIPAKLIVVGMTSTGFTIAEPSDPNTLDVVGFDTATPTIISDFVSDRI